MNKKIVYASFNMYETDAFRDYLEAMALKGWRLARFGSLFMHFEACDPHPIRYCVELMEKPSSFASNQTLGLKRYREFCQEAGWNYIGTNGLLHVFYTEDMNAVPVETDVEERYERIKKAYRGSLRPVFVMFALIILLNLFTCFQNRTLFSSNGFIILILLLALLYIGGDFYLWNRKVRISIETCRMLPKLSWQSARMKNWIMIASILIVVILFFAYTLGFQFSGLYARVLLIYLAVYGIMLAIFSALLHWLREKNTFSTKANIAIYWGTAAVLILLITVIGSALIFRLI